MPRITVHDFSDIQERAENSGCGTKDPQGIIDEEIRQIILKDVRPEMILVTKTKQKQ